MTHQVPLCLKINLSELVEVLIDNSDRLLPSQTKRIIDALSLSKIPETTQLESRITKYCRFYKLTNRESEVLDLLVQGLNTHEIAKRLNIVIRTVESHLRSIFDKTGCTNRVELVAMSLGNQSKN